MNDNEIKDINTIGVCSRDLNIKVRSINFKSRYIPYISFKDIEQKKKAEDYIEERVSNFFSELIKIQIDDIPKARIPTSHLITDYDFNNIAFTYFYKTLFDDLGKRDEQNNLIPKIKWGAVFDERCTPVETAFLTPLRKGDAPRFKKFSDNPRYRKYGTIDINGTPIFYYIYFTVQEILNAIR